MCTFRCPHLTPCDPSLHTTRYLTHSSLFSPTCHRVCDCVTTNSIQPPTCIHHQQDCWHQPAYTVSKTVGWQQLETPDDQHWPHPPVTRTSVSPAIPSAGSTSDHRSCSTPPPPPPPPPPPLIFASVEDPWGKSVQAIAVTNGDGSSFAAPPFALLYPCRLKLPWLTQKPWLMMLCLRGCCWCWRVGTPGGRRAPRRT